MDEAGEAPENMEALKNAVMEKLSEWYMRNHGVGTMANVEDMCTLLQASIKHEIVEANGSSTSHVSPRAVTSTPGGFSLLPSRRR